MRKRFRRQPRPDGPASSGRAARSGTPRTDVRPEVLGFDTAAEEYERGRPDYPTPAVERLRTELDLRPGRTIIDLAAGTGKLTRALRGSGAAIVGVEPLAGMRNVFERMLPGVRVVEGTAESIPLAPGSADAVVVGQAFHWFATERALPEIRRVLRPHGGLGLIWNRRDESVAWVAEVSALLDRFDPGIPRIRTEQWKAAFRDGAGFSPLGHHAYPFVQRLDRATLEDRFLSVSFVAVRPAEERRRIGAELQAIADRAFGGEAAKIELPYRTDVYWTHRID